MAATRYSNPVAAQEQFQKFSEVKSIVVKAAERMGMPIPTDEFCKAIYQHCGKYGIETIRQTFRFIETENLNTFPKLGKIIDKVEKNKIFHDNKYLSPADKLCRYLSQEESVLSKSFCQKNDIQEQHVFYSKITFGGEIYCPWHYRVRYAEIFPDSSDAHFLIRFLGDLDKIGIRTAEQLRNHA